MIHVRLGGGIGAGKSTAAARFAGLGAHVISADDVGRAALVPGTPETAAVLELFPEVDRGGGVIDRRALAAIVFGDDAALARLEEITLPAIRGGVLRQVAAASAAVVIVEIPLLKDVLGERWPWVVVDAPDEIRIARTMERGMSESEVRAVMGSQPTRGEWLAAAEWVVDNSGDEEHLGEQCRLVWEAITAA